MCMCMKDEKYETMQVWVIRLLQLKLVIRQLILSVNNKKSGLNKKVSLRRSSSVLNFHNS